MNLKPKTVRRLLLLSLVSVLLVASIFSLFVVRHWQNQRVLEQHRAEGLAAYEAGDYYEALEKCAFYFRRSRTLDPDVLLALGDSRRRLEEADNRHLVLSMRPYQLYLEVRPEDEEVRRTLLELYNQAGYFIEARDLAAQMRPADLEQAGPEHLPVLREEAVALAGARLFGQRFDAVLGRIFEIEPLDVDAHLVKLDALAQADERQEARRWGREIVEAHGGDPRALLIYAASLLVHPSSAEIADAREKLCQAAGLNAETGARIAPASYPDERYVRRLIVLLEGVRAFPQSREVLVDAARQFDDLQLRRRLARHLWQTNNDKALVEMTTTLEGDRDADSDLLALRALASARQGDVGGARAIVEMLEARRGDYRAEAWVAAAPLAIDATDGTDFKAISVLREAAKTNPHEPIIQVMLGDRLAALGRREEARRAWTAAASMQLGASWATPWVRIAESLLPEGRTEEAVVAANQALVIDSDLVLVNVVWFEAQAARIQKGSQVGPEPAAVLERLEQALGGLDAMEPEIAQELRERLLPVHVMLLARTNQGGKAREIAMAGVAGGLSVQTLQQLAAISVSERLGFDEELMDRAALSSGGAAAVVHARAMQLARDGRPEAGLELLEEAAGPSPDLDSQLAIARYLDAIGHERAIAEWRRLGDAHAGNLQIQLACLGSQSAAGDRRFVERTIERYRKLQGKDEEGEDVPVRIARARMLLHGDPTRRERDEAIGILASVVNANPLISEPRLLLAGALAMSDRVQGIMPDLPRATMQLTEAARLEPRNAQIALELAGMLQAQRENARAREHLLRIARETDFGMPARRRAAEMLLAGGDAATARDVLAEIVSAQEGGASGSLLAALAEAQRQAGDQERARQTYGHLADGAADDAGSILATAIYWAKQGQEERARQVLERLETLEASAGKRALVLARFEAEAGDPAAAVAHFEAAVRDMPERTDVWRLYALMHLNQGQPRDARAVAGRGLAAVPGDPGLAVLQERAALAADRGDGDASLRPLIEALLTDDMGQEPARMLEAIEAARVRGELEDPQALLRLAGQFQNAAPLQMYVAQQLALLDPAAAAGVAIRAMNIDTSDPEPARLAAELFMSLGRWNDMLSASRAWRARDRSGSAEPDVAIAEAQWRMGRPAEAMRTLAPRLSEAAASPEDPISLSVLNMHSRLLVLGGREAEARRLLAPLMSESPGVRIMVWIGLAARDIPSLASSLAWLEEAQRHIPADAASEHLAAAVALSMLADRFAGESQQLLEQAMMRLNTMVNTPALASAGAWEALGVIRHRLGDLGGAEAAYQRALEIDPKRAAALNNLATIAAQTRGDLDEALVLAKRSVEATDTPDPGHLATLASVHREIAQRNERQGNAEGAKEAYRLAAAAFGRMAAMSPLDPGPRSQQAQSLWLAGDARGAAGAYERVLRLPNLPPAMAAAIKNNLASAMRSGNPRTADLERARELIHEALTAGDHPAFYDTLGWIELDLRRPEDAQRAFRSALERAQQEGQDLSTAAVGLAFILKDGDDDARREARRLLENVQGDLGPQYRQHLEVTRTSLAGSADAGQR